MKKASPANLALLPLSWPAGIERHARRNMGSCRFHTGDMATGVLGALADLDNSTGKRIEAISITVGDADRVIAGDPGAAVHFKWDDAAYCFAVDRYLDVPSNLWAIKLLLDHRTAEARSVSLASVRASMTGFRIAESAHQDWRVILGFRPGETPTVDQLRKAYRKRVAGGAIVDAAFDHAIHEIEKGK